MIACPRQPKGSCKLMIPSYRGMKGREEVGAPPCCMFCMALLALEFEGLLGEMDSRWFKDLPGKSFSPFPSPPPSPFLFNNIPSMSFLELSPTAGNPQKTGNPSRLPCMWWEGWAADGVHGAEQKA